MQNGGISSLNTALVALAALASILGIPLTHFLTKRKQVTDERVALAGIHKTDAETREIDSRIINEAYEKMEEYGQTVQNLRIQSTWDQVEIKRLEWELSLSAGREKVLEEQVKLAHAELLMLRKPRLGP